MPHCLHSVLPDKMTESSSSISPLRAWEQDRPGGFNDRIAARCFLPERPAANKDSLSTQHPHFTSVNSMAVEKEGNMMSTSIAVPNLSMGSRSCSAGSVDPKMAAKIEVINILDSDSTGNLVPPPRRQPEAVYHCLFHVLPCGYTTDHIATWKIHVLSHFRSRPLPLTASCQWCSHNFKQTEPGRAWDALLEHVAHDHFERGHTLASSRANLELMKYLYQHKIITEDQLKAVQLAPSPDSPAYDPSQDSVRASIGSSDEPYCSSYSPRREKRMREQRRGISVA